MTLSIAELLFEDATLKNNQPLPETASEDFTVNQAFLNSLKKTVSGKIFSKLPDAKLVKKAIDEIKSVDSQEEKDKIQKQVEPIINDPLGAFSKQDLMRIAISATNVSRLGPVVFDVAQMKTGKEQVKGFTGIDLQLIKSTQIIPFLVMTKEGEVLSGENNRKGSFGYAFLAPAYYAKIEEKNIPVYEELFPGLLENHIINGEESKFAANVENLELPVVPIDSEILKFVQQAFKNQKTLPALVQKLQTTYRSTMQNIVRDEEEKGDSPAERQSQEELNAGLFENNSLVYKQGIKSLLVENLSNSELSLLDVEHSELFENFLEFNRKVAEKNGGSFTFKYLFDTLFERDIKTIQKYAACYVTISNRIAPGEAGLNDWGKKLNSNFSHINHHAKELQPYQSKPDKSLTRADTDDIKRIQGNLTHDLQEIFKNKEAKDRFNLVLNMTLREAVERLTDNLASVLKDITDNYNFEKDYKDWFSRPRFTLEGRTRVINQFIKGIKESVEPKDLVNLVLHLNHKGQFIPSVQENKAFKNKEKILLNEQSQGFWDDLGDWWALLGSSYLKEAAVWYQICLLHDTYEPNIPQLHTTGSKIIEQLKYMYPNTRSEEDQSGVDGDEVDNFSDEESPSDAQAPIPEEPQVAQPKSKPKPPSPTDFKGRLENAARELERMLSLIVNRQEQSEEPNIVLARILYNNVSSELRGSLYNTDDNDELRKLTFGSSDGFEDVENSLLNSFNTIIKEEIEDLDFNIDINFDNIGENIYDIIKTNKIPDELEKAIFQSARDRSESGGEDQSTYVENLDEFKKRVNETCQRFNKALKTVNIGSSSTQRNLVLKNKPILNFVARKIREEDKSYEDFFKELLQNKEIDELATILKYFSFSPMFDFDGKLIDNLFKNFERHVEEDKFVDLIFYILRSNLNQEPTPIKKIMENTLNDLFPNNESKVQEIISGSQEYKDQCELFYGVEPSEEEAKDSQLEELCKSISRKLLEAQDEKAYNEKRREAQEKYEKEMLDAKKEQVREEGFRFGVGAAIPLTVGVLGAVATGGLGALALATAGILGMPVGALIGHATVSLKHVEKDKVNKSDLTKEINDLAKENLKGLDASIIEALKKAIVEGIYVHERSLTELLFEMKDVDLIGKKSRKKEIKKRVIKRKDFEDILTRNKVLMYDSKYASFPADISAIKNEFIESLNLLLSYYYNATIENVKQATSSAEVKTNFIRTAVSNRVEAAKDTLGDDAGQQLVQEFNQTTEEYDLDLDSEDLNDMLQSAGVVDAKFNFEDVDVFSPGDSSPGDSSPGDSSPGDSSSNELSSSSKESGSVKPEPQAKAEDDLDWDVYKLESIMQDVILKSPPISLIRIDSISKADTFKEVIVNKDEKYGSEYLPVAIMAVNRKFDDYIIGYHYENFISLVASNKLLETTEESVGRSVGEIIRFSQVKETNTQFYKNIIDSYVDQEFIAIKLVYFGDINEAVRFFKYLKNKIPSIENTMFEKLNRPDLFKEGARAGGNYILGSLTNLLFESNNKEDLSVVKRVYNKSDSINSSSLEKEWRRLWNIYK